MKNKILKAWLCLFLITTFTTNDQVFAKNKVAIPNDVSRDYTFLIGNLLHTDKEIEEYKANSSKFLRKSTIALLSLIPTLWMAYNLKELNAPFLSIDRESQHQFEWNKIWNIKNITFDEVLETGRHTIIPTLFYCMPIFITSYFLLNKLHKAVANRKETISNAMLLTSYIKKWETYKKLTPSKFHEQFNKLYNQYLKNELNINEFEATKIIGDIIRESVENLQMMHSKKS